MTTEPKPELVVSDRDVATAMIMHGGDFVSKLGRAVIETNMSAHWIFAKALLQTLESADLENRGKVSSILAEHIVHFIDETMNESELRQIVKDAWPEYWAEYTEVAKYDKRQLLGGEEE